MPLLRHRIHDDYTASPGGPTAPWHLVEAISGLSVADSWDEVRAEWMLDHIFIADGPASCLCGHPISECCVISNQWNDNLAVVGNVCVTQFMGLDSEAIFRGLRRISADICAGLNPETIDHALGEGWINAWEAGFSRNTYRKHRLTHPQLAKRREINQKLLAHCLRMEVVHA